jgi:hypothetical protein
MDPFGADGEDTGDLSSFQPQGDASAFNGEYGLVPLHGICSHAGD